MPLDKITILKQIDDALALAKHKIARCKYSDLSDLPIDELNDVITTLTYTIEQLSSPKSAHRKQVEQHQYSLDHLHRAIKPLAGALMSLRRAYEQDYIRSFEELTRADMFADFLEMASHLLETGYKDAAAVIVGSVLEEHLRKLVTKHGTGISKPDGSPKKADHQLRTMRGRCLPEG